MIKTALKKKECPYCREKILKNEEIDEDDNEENENYAVEVNVEVFGDMEFSENGDNNSDSAYELENNNGDLTLIVFSQVGYLTYSYLKEIIEIGIYKYLFYKNHHPDYINKFKNCDFELFKEIPLFFGYSIECSDNDKRKVYDLFFKDSKDVYAFANSGSNFEQDKRKINKTTNKKKLEEKLLNKAINEIKTIEQKIKRNKNKNKKNKSKKENVNKNRCLKF
jgi:hypothetical protein